MQTAFTVSVSDRSDPFLIRLTGEFDMAALSTFEASLDGLWETPSTGVVLDLRSLTFMDCSGLHACITAWDRARQDGRQLLFVGATRAVRRVFELTGTEYILDQTDQMSTSTKTSFAATEAPGIRVAGELDMRVAEELAKLVGTSSNLDAPLLIDMTNVTFVDMAGWRAIWDTLRRGDANDPKAIVLASPAVMRLVRHLPMQGEVTIRIIEPPESPDSPVRRDGPDTSLWWRSAMFDQMADAVLVADEDMRYLDANPAAVEVLGSSVVDLRECTVADVVAAQREWTEDEYERFVRDGRWQGEVLLRSKTGTVTADASASTVVGPSGQRVFISVIRARKDAQAETPTPDEPAPSTQVRSGL
jgi:anti-sigma B factor antagonist